jgi:hypothetical protein
VAENSKVFTGLILGDATMIFFHGNCQSLWRILAIHPTFRKFDDMQMAMPVKPINMCSIVPTLQETLPLQKYPSIPLLPIPYNWLAHLE